MANSSDSVLVDIGTFPFPNNTQELARDFIMKHHHPKSVQVWPTTARIFYNSTDEGDGEEYSQSEAERQSNAGNNDDSRTGGEEDEEEEGQEEEEKVDIYNDREDNGQFGEVDFARYSGNILFITPDSATPPTTWNSRWAGQMMVLGTGTLLLYNEEDHWASQSDDIVAHWIHSPDYDQGYLSFSEKPGRSTEPPSQATMARQFAGANSQQSQQGQQFYRSVTNTTAWRPVTYLTLPTNPHVHGHRGWTLYASSADDQHLVDNDNSRGMAQLRSRVNLPPDMSRNMRTGRTTNRSDRV